MDTKALGDISIDLVAYKKKLNELRKKFGESVGKETEGTKSIEFRFDEIVLLSSLIKNEIGKIGTEINRKDQEKTPPKEPNKPNKPNKPESESEEESGDGESSDDDDDELSEDENQSATKFFEKELQKFDDKYKISKKEKKKKEFDDIYEEESDSDYEEEGEVYEPKQKREFQKTDANQITKKAIVKGILIFDPEELEKVIRGGKTSVADSDSLIGIGSFGKVYQTWMRNRGQIEDVVIKKVKIGSSIDTKVVQSEIVILSICHHLNIAEIKGFAISQTHAYVIMNHYDEIDIYAMKQMSLRDKIKILQETARGGEYLHKNNIIHRDLKWDNVMKKGGIAKILDFGISKIGGQNKTMVGTPEMVPPEIVMGEGKVEYTSKVDIFPYGIMMWTLLRENSLPYGKRTDPRIMFKVAEGKRPKTKGLDFGTESLKELMMECWSNEPSKRSSFSQIVQRLEKILKEEKL